MTRILVLDSGLVYRNPAPNIRSSHAFFPSAIEVKKDELLVTLDIGSAMENPDVRSFACRSFDGGASWTEPLPVFEPDPEMGPVSTSIRTAKSPNGEVLGLLTLFDRSRLDAGLANPKTDGFVETTFLVQRSTDGGRTWSQAVPISPPIDWSSFETCSPLFYAKPNRVLLPTSLWKNWDGEQPLGMKAIAFRSDDGGRSWKDCVDVMNGSVEGIAYWEQKQALLSDGRILAVCWAYDSVSGSSLNNRYCFSQDDGESYRPPLESPLKGETCTPISIEENRVLCVYRRTDQKGLWAHLAGIEGDAWVQIADSPLLGTETESYGKNSASVFEQLGTLRFGYPSLTRLTDGDFFVVFWTIEDCVTVIRWFRLKLED